MMQRWQQGEKVEISYEEFGYDKLGIKREAPRFRKEPVDFKNVKFGEDIVVHPGNVSTGTILRGALAAKAKASPILLQVMKYADGNGYPFQVSTPYWRGAANLIVAQSGPTGAGTTKTLEGWYLYDEFPLKDRIQTRASNQNPKGITVDENGVYFAEATNLFKMPLDFSSITQLTPSGAPIPAVNGLTSDGVYLYTVNWDGAISKTRFYQITISGNNYSWSEIGQLNFRIDKIGCWTGKFFIGYDAAGAKLKEWQRDLILWREIPYGEPNFMGALVLNRFTYIAIQAGQSNLVNLMPLRI